MKIALRSDKKMKMILKIARVVLVADLIAAGLILASLAFGGTTHIAQAQTYAGGVCANGAANPCYTCSDVNMSCGGVAYSVATITDAANNCLYVETFRSNPGSVY